MQIAKFKFDSAAEKQIRLKLQQTEPSADLKSLRPEEMSAQKAKLRMEKLNCEQQLRQLELKQRCSEVEREIAIFEQLTKGKKHNV